MRSSLRHPILGSGRRCREICGGSRRRDPGRPRSRRPARRTRARGVLDSPLVLGGTAGERGHGPGRTARILCRRRHGFAGGRGAGGGAAHARFHARLRRRAQRPVDTDAADRCRVLRRAGRLALYWTLVLGLLGSASLLASAALGIRLAAYATGVMAAIVTFFLVVLVLIASPFDVLAITPVDGIGLNPVLRDSGMLIHPPVVLAGFASFAVPFSFAAAALLANRIDSAWIAHTRRFALLAWSFQTTGLVLGMWWAYHVLGWGGYWGWDPVEN